MPRRKKTELPATPEQIKNIENIVGEPINDFLKNFADEGKRKIFAENLAKKLRQTDMLTTLSSSNGKYQPIYSEKVFQKINVNPVVGSSSDIEKWLLAPQFFDDNFRHLSQYLSYAVGQYQRSLWHLSTIKAYNYVLLPSDSDVEGNINSSDYLHAYDICLRTLQKMNIKYQIPKADLQTMYDGVSFWWVDETSDAISLIPMPTDYCYITAPWTYGYRFAIDLVFFDQYRSVPQQIPELYEAYKIFVAMRDAALSGKELAPYQYYEVPVDKGWVFTFDPVHPDKLPPLTSAMASSLDILSYKELLKNKVALDLYKIIPMKIPLDKDNKQMVITYKMAEEITQAIQCLLPENIKVFSSPFDSENVVNADQSGRFDEIVNISNDSYYASSGFSKSLFGSKEAKQGTALALSADVDFNYASFHMYRQYENFINFQLGLKSRTYKFQVTMFGNSLNREKEIDMYANLVRTTNSHLLEFFASSGKEPFQVKSSLLLEDKLGLRDLMKPLVSAFNSNPSDGGRPDKLDADKTDSGANTDDYGQADSKNFALKKCLYCGNKLGRNAVDGVFCSEDCKVDYAEEILDK